eukprot:6735145-Karenia_brevis.AAC.1
MLARGGASQERVQFKARAQSSVVRPKAKAKTQTAIPHKAYPKGKAKVQAKPQPMVKPKPVAKPKPPTPTPMS